jgi:6-pyruvoyltetrahydropterin/6-carboxytetrahydropterin synthase
MSEGFGVRLYKQSFNFASAHFLIFGDGRREQLHGHNYRVRIELLGALGAGGLLADFIEIKPIILEICGELDHRVLIPNLAKSLTIVESEQEIEVKAGDGARFVFPRCDVLLLPLSNTSTERLAELISGRLLDRFRKAIPDAQLSKLRVEVEESGGQCGWYEVPLNERMEREL